MSYRTRPVKSIPDTAELKGGKEVSKRYSFAVFYNKKCTDPLSYKYSQELFLSLDTATCHGCHHSGFMSGKKPGQGQCLGLSHRKMLNSARSTAPTDGSGASLASASPTTFRRRP